MHYAWCLLSGVQRCLCCRCSCWLSCTDRKEQSWKRQRKRDRELHSTIINTHTYNIPCMKPLKLWCGVVKVCLISLCACYQTVLLLRCFFFPSAHFLACNPFCLFGAISKIYTSECSAFGSVYSF